jgi:hypothetical protein
LYSLAGNLPSPPQKRARYSKFLDAEELEEIMMEEVSGEEFQELNEFVEPTENILWRVRLVTRRIIYGFLI